MEELKIAVSVSVLVFCFWIISFLFSWLVQWAWSWIDDKKLNRTNWLACKINFSKWKYPVYNEYNYAELKKAQEEGDVYGFACDIANNNRSCSNLTDGVDYTISVFGCPNGVFYTIAITIAAPVALVIGYKIYPVTLVCLSVVLLAFLARFTRRLSKKFANHEADKNAHQ